MNVRQQMTTLKADMQAIVDRAKSADRDLTPTEASEVESMAARYSEMKGRVERAEKASRLVADLASAPDVSDEAMLGRGKAAPGGSRWAKSVMQNLTSAAAGIGVKALFQGEISTPPVVEVVELPTTPTTLLDLIPREGLSEHTFSYLREVVRTNNANVVADNATKPTSVFTFEEIEDRARVIAHLSEPFPLRYLTDHSSMMQVLDGQMRVGVVQELESQVVSGDGTGENFTGILTTTGVTAVPYTTDLLTTIRKARTTLAAKGESPNAWVFHPNDLETLDLMREDGATGGFLMDSAAYGAIFGEGIQRVSSLAVPQGTALLGDWNQLRIRVREDVGTLAATQAGELFQKNQAMLRTEGRFGFQFKRPQAMAVVDLTA